jgi:rhamnosyltransferase
MKGPVSVIMRSKNADWVIAQALAGLFSQDFRDFELVIVDSGSTDRTLEIVRQYPHRFVHVPASNYYPGVVLNEAIAQTTSDVVVFQNSDSVPLTPQTLGTLLAAFDDPAVVAAFARQLPRPEAQTWVRRDYAVSFPATAPAPAWVPLSLPLAAMRRSAWEAHHFYTDAWGSEDSEWGHWARTNGLVVRYVPEAVVMHSHDYTLRQLYGRRFIEGEADAFIYREPFGWWDVASRTVTSSARDAWHHVHALDVRGLLVTPARRLVYHWAYWKGHDLGTRRRLTGNRDTSIGQQVVLSRHDSNRGNSAQS